MGSKAVAIWVSLALATVAGVTATLVARNCAPKPGLDHQQEWAVKHAHETCVFRHLPGIMGEWRMMLVPVGDEVEGMDTVHPIGHCDPQE